MAFRGERRESYTTQKTGASSDRRTTAPGQQFVQVSANNNTSSNAPPAYAIAPGSLVGSEKPSVAPLRTTANKPVTHTSHHNPTLQGLTPRAAVGVAIEEKNVKGARRQVIQRDLSMDDEPKDAIDAYFHKKRDRRLPTLPDFNSPPPIIRKGPRQPEKPPLLGEYNPHTYKEYKRMMNDVSHMKRGGLGANDSDQAQKEREKRKKMFQYGASVNAVNFALMDVPEPEGLHGKTVPKAIPRKLTKEGELALLRRDRAMKYGEQFAHPVHRGKASTPQPDQALLNELRRLEGKHAQDLEEIARIKAQLNLEER